MVWYDALKSEPHLLNDFNEWLDSAEQEALTALVNSHTWEKFLEARGGLAKIRAMRTALTAKEREEHAVVSYLREAGRTGRS